MDGLDGLQRNLWQDALERRDGCLCWSRRACTCRYAPQATSMLPRTAHKLWPGRAERQLLMFSCAGALPHGGQAAGPWSCVVQEVGARLGCSPAGWRLSHTAAGAAASRLGPATVPGPACRPVGERSADGRLELGGAAPDRLLACLAASLCSAGWAPLAAACPGVLAASGALRLRLRCHAC